MSNLQCTVCKKSFEETELISGHGIRHEIEDLIREDVPGWNDHCYICQDDYDKYRDKYISKLLQDDERVRVEFLKDEVLKSIQESALIASNINQKYEEKITLGNKVADQIAHFGGSWGFIFTFFSILFTWIILNSIHFWGKAFDPFPFILLNLILSCLAAIQAPIIMMSQNRLETKDRIRAENDYKVNLKSEIEIRTLHEKVDHLLLDQWSKMMKLQEMQISLLEEIRGELKRK